jgi:MFS family permease
MLEEAVTIIAELFTGEQLTYHGPHYQVETARLYSVPRVPPPIYVSGFGEKSARLIRLAIFAVFALPGYFLAIALLDKTGRRPIQLLGFGLMGAMFLLIGLVPGVTQNAAPFLALYGISFFFTGFGPNTTTFVYPAELFPVQVRTTGHGISAALGKMGAFAGAFLFPVMLASSLGIRGTEVVAALVLLAGLALTAFLLPEPRGKSLEELSAQAYNLPGLALAPTWARAGTPGGARQRGASRTALKADERGGRWP